MTFPNWMESPKIHVPNHQPDNIMETYYPLAICYIAIEHGHRNSWFTIKNGGCVHSFLYVYQRVLVSFPWTLCWSYTVYIYIYMYSIYIYGSVSKPCTPGEHQNSWFIPLKMVLIGIDPYPYIYIYIHQCPLENSWWFVSKAPTSYINMIPENKVPGSHPILWHWDCPASLPVLSTSATPQKLGQVMEPDTEKKKRLNSEIECRWM